MQKYAYGAPVVEVVFDKQELMSLCGDAGIALLDGMLNGKSMFGRREDAELRACAAVALGRIGSAEARASLQRAATEKDVVVRNAVGRALRGATT